MELRVPMTWVLGTAALALMVVGLAGFLPGQDAAAQEQCFDFATGGGSFPSFAGTGKANFGFNAGYRNGPSSPLKGEVNVVDHGAGTTVKALTVENYSGSGNDCVSNGTACDRSWNGTAHVTTPTFDGNCFYFVEVVDEGSPGRNDRFHIATCGYNGFTNQLPAGNIEVHKASCRP